jgi:hypothetical protein
MLLHLLAVFSLFHFHFLKVVNTNGVVGLHQFFTGGSATPKDFDKTLKYHDTF